MRKKIHSAYLRSQNKSITLLKKENAKKRNLLLTMVGLHDIITKLTREARQKSMRIAMKAKK